jgi:hypothetical protein
VSFVVTGVGVGGGCRLFPVDLLPVVALSPVDTSVSSVTHAIGPMVMQVQPRPRAVPRSIAVTLVVVVVEVVAANGRTF